LPACLDSILKQTNKSFEVLLIDDGSLDDSSIICDQYATLDNRIKVFHKENGGVSSARNLGLDNASGEWISFIDADDSIDNEFLNLEGIPEGYVIVEKSHYRIFDDTVKPNISFSKASSISIQKDIFRFFVNKRTNSVWNKIYNKRVLNNTRFITDVTIGEDFLFNLMCIKNVQRYFFRPIGAYYYTNRKGSATYALKEVSFDRLVILINNINYIISITYKTPFENLGKCIISSSYIYRICRMSQLLSKDQFKFIKEVYSSIHLFQMNYVSIKGILQYFYSKLSLFFLFRIRYKGN